MKVEKEMKNLERKNFICNDDERVERFVKILCLETVLFYLLISMKLLCEQDTLLWKYLCLHTTTNTTSTTATTIPTYLSIEEGR